MTDARALLARLVSFPTVSRDSNLDCIGFIRDHLQQHGVASTTIPNEDGTKANLFATVGPDAPGGIVLSGHTDVVPVDGQAWTSDPWTLTEREGRLYGRGTCDMKGFVAIMLGAAAAASSRQLARPLHLAFSYDEELGCTGAPSMVDAMAARLGVPQAVVVGEPSSLKVVSGHKTSTAFFTDVKGHTVHSSEVHRGVSAVAVAARLITWLDDRMAREQAEADPLCPFDPPFTTLHCGQVQGGTAANIVAESCRFVTDIRAVPAQDVMAFRREYEAFVRTVIEPKMQAIAPASGVRITDRSVVHGLQPDMASSAETLLRGLTGDNGQEVVSYGTEAGLFQRAGWPTVVCGPGSIAQAHQADEYITLAQFEAGERLVARMVATLEH